MVASIEERNKAAKAASDAIDPIADDIMREWGMTFAEIQQGGKEPEFDREIIKRIYENEDVKSQFLDSMVYTQQNYGKIWFEFNVEQRNIIALKDSNIFW